jgi:hypothetical protein
LNNNRYDCRNGNGQYDNDRNRGSRDNFKSSFKPRDSSRSRARFGLIKSCFICKKPDCHSWNHTLEEQVAEKARFKAKNLYRFKNTNSRDFDKSFNSVYLQYIAEIEGELDESGESNEDEDDLSDVTSAFATLLADTDDVKETGTSWFTSVKSLLTVPTLVDDLNSLSLVHQLTGENPTLKPDEPPVKDVYAFAMEGTSRYDSRHFYGIVIDTRASKYLIAGFDQF